MTKTASRVFSQISPTLKQIKNKDVEDFFNIPTIINEELRIVNIKFLQKYIKLDGLLLYFKISYRNFYNIVDRKKHFLTPKEVAKFDENLCYLVFFLKKMGLK